MTEGVRLDDMSIGILRDKEAETHVDYFYVADLWASDPRYRNRQMNVGQSRGLFRVDKLSQHPELLYAAKGDESGKCFQAAASKVVREFQAHGAWPDKTQYAAG